MAGSFIPIVFFYLGMINKRCFCSISIPSVELPVSKNNSAGLGWIAVKANPASEREAEQSISGAQFAQGEIENKRPR